MKNPHTPNLTWIGSWWPEIWPHEYLISPTEISVNWPGSWLVWNRANLHWFQWGRIRYSCGHISGPHEPIPTKFGLWMFFIMLHRYMVSKTLKCNKSFCDVIAKELSYKRTQNGLVLLVFKGDEMTQIMHCLVRNQYINMFFITFKKKTF